MAKRIPNPTRVVIALATDIRLGFGLLPLASARSTTARLCLAAAFSLLAGPIAAISRPPAPAPSRFATGRATVTAQRMRSLERLLTAFEQTAPPSHSRRDVLHSVRRSAMLRSAHGSDNSPTASLVAKRLLRSEAFLLILPPSSSGGQPYSLIATQPPPAINPWQFRPTTQTNWTSHKPPLTRWGNCLEQQVILLGFFTLRSEDYPFNDAVDFRIAGRLGYR